MASIRFALRDRMRESKPAIGKLKPRHSGSSAPAACATGASAAEFLPRKLELPAMARAAHSCRGCPLYCNATQVVFGEGPAGARLMLIGEQPGDQEDLAGKPFVGPSGRVLDEALEQAGISRDQVYVTNAVKHFKWKPSGQRRLHAKPTSREIKACRPWLEAEIQAIHPPMIICLGATAAQSLLGNAFRLTQHRGEVLTNTSWSPWLLATVHPSSLLRIPDAAARQAARESFFADFRTSATQLSNLG